jgi:hypothetical protein
MLVFFIDLAKLEIVCLFLKKNEECTLFVTEGVSNKYRIKYCLFCLSVLCKPLSPLFTLHFMQLISCDFLLCFHYTSSIKRQSYV